MKLSKILMFSFVLLCFILPYITIAQAADKPGYVGVNEDQEIIWNTEFDKGPLEDYAEDLGYAEGKPRDDFVAGLWDPSEFDDDAVKWKVIVKDISEEKDTDYDGNFIDVKDIDYVKLTIAIYDQEEGEEWDDVDKSEKYKLYDSEEELYADQVIESMDDYGFGLGSLTVTSAPLAPIDRSVEWPCFFVPKRLKLDDICEEIDDEVEGDISLYNRDDKYDIGAEDVDYFFRKKDVGLTTSREALSTETLFGPVEEFDSVIKFTDEGIMYYYEWSYDGDTIAKFELDSIGGVYLVENWWWIALIAGAIIIGVIIIVVVIAAKRR